MMLFDTCQSVLTHIENELDTYAYSERQNKTIDEKHSFFQVPCHSMEKYGNKSYHKSFRINTTNIRLFFHDGWIVSIPIGTLHTFQI